MQIATNRHDFPFDVDYRFYEIPKLLCRDIPQRRLVVRILTISISIGLRIDAAPADSNINGRSPGPDMSVILCTLFSWLY